MCGRAGRFVEQAVSALASIALIIWLIQRGKISIISPVL